MQFKKILVAYDGSSDSTRALEAAETISKDHHSHLTVVYVRDQLDETIGYVNYSNNAQPFFREPDPLLGSAPKPIDPAERVILENDQSEQVIQDAKYHLSPTTDADYEVLAGKAATEITKYAEANDVDLIVVGNRGLGGVKKLFMGSVSSKITNDASCAVFVVK